METIPPPPTKKKKKMGSRAKEQYQTKVFTVFVCSFNLNISILHRLKNRFLQLILNSLDSASWELHQYSRRMCGLMKKPKVDTRSRESNSELRGRHSTTRPRTPHKF